MSRFFRCLVVLCALLLSATLTATVSGDLAVWTGLGGLDCSWSNNANWEGSTPPEACDDVEILDATYCPDSELDEEFRGESQPDFEVCKFTLGSGMTLVIGETDEYPDDIVFEVCEIMYVEGTATLEVAETGQDPEPNIAATALRIGVLTSLTASELHNNSASILVVSSATTSYCTTCDCEE
jgi:hypothetical protein